ncbi:MAG: GTP-dependent dephospho-CoA kinase family protein [Candidatus Hydrothermarchaeaceae archaeon]
MKDLRVPEELRILFKKPFGELYRGRGLGPANRIKKELKNERVIIVGDVTLRNAFEVGIRPSLIVVDMKTKRAGGAKTRENEAVVKNPPGMITEELWHEIHEKIDVDDAKILVDGEEDLAVLPCVLEADWGTVILYGQPDEGIVLVRVNEEKKMEASILLKMLTRVGA